MKFTKSAVHLGGGSSLIRYMEAGSLRRSAEKGAVSSGKFVDVHAHYLPDFYASAMRQAGMNDVDGMPMPVWSVDAAIEMMDDNSIATQMLSVSSPGLTFTSGEKARELARKMNDFAAGVIRDHAARFGAFTLVPLPDIDGALAEIEYALDTLKFSGVGLLSNYNGAYLGDPVFDPVFAELHRRKAVVFVHPTKPPNFAALNVGLPAPLIEYPFDSTRMAANLIRTGTLTRYPGIKLIVAHGGGTIPYLYPRLLTALGSEGGNIFPSFYYDMTATAMPGQTQVLRDVVDTGNLLMGFDFPFMDPSTAKLMVSGLNLGKFSASQMRGIEQANAYNLLPNLLRPE